MTALTLKIYQQQALDSLARFLAAGRSTGSLAAAWAQEMQRQAEGQADARTQAPYRASAFGNTPCVCLRIPTGGGKTLLASHAIALMARTWRQADFPVVLWLVPSTTNRDQTLVALQQPGHAYRAALEAAYGPALLVLDLDAAPTLAPQDLGRKAIVLVATMQSFRVRSTKGRNVYAFSEDFDAHFAQLESTGADLSALEKVEESDLPTEPGQGFLTRADLGRVKHSLANLLALTGPLVVVDEAHNAQTDTTFETLRRVAPSAILELTATPVPKKTNVLYSVGARELQAEDMVKLPVMLAEHKDWTDAVRDAVLRRAHLEAEAAHETLYVRPIVLFQAQDKTGDVPPAVLGQHLLDEKYATDAEIVIATGDQRGLDGLNLFDRASPVRYVITVEALKEGWDCSFAYVLCSLQNVRSGKDVEQLLGRVLRMPYATRRKSPALNRAYAHVVARSFSEAASALVDRMVQGMGFEALNAAAVVLPDPGVPGLFDGDATAPQSPPVPVLTLTLSPAAAAALEGEPDVLVAAPCASGDAPTLQVAGEVSDALLGRVLAALPPAEHASVSAQVQQHNHRIHAARAPAQRGVPFAPVPRLCVGLQVGGGEGDLVHWLVRAFDDIHALKSLGEEFDCAKALDTLPALKHWVRNIERQPQFSFWLPTATDYFYPDFVAELHDGRLLVVEYKGDAYATNDDSGEKRAIGDAWARASGGRGLFLMAEKALNGLDLTAQLQCAVAPPRFAP